MSWIDDHESEINEAEAESLATKNKKPREYWIREIVDFMGNPGTFVYEHDFKCGDVHVREVDPAYDATVVAMAAALKKVEEQSNPMGKLHSIAQKALELYKQWENKND